jgi:hypothetical protein
MEKTFENRYSTTIAWQLEQCVQRFLAEIEKLPPRSKKEIEDYLYMVKLLGKAKKETTLEIFGTIRRHIEFPPFQDLMITDQRYTQLFITAIAEKYSGKDTISNKAERVLNDL